MSYVLDTIAVGATDPHKKLAAWVHHYRSLVDVGRVPPVDHEGTHF